MHVCAGCMCLSSTLVCFAFLASTPGLYRKKCKACRHDNHFNSKKCKQCGGALDIQSPGRPRGTTASEGYGVSVVHATCSYGYEYQATDGVSSGQEAPKTASLSLVQHYCAFH